MCIAYHWIARVLAPIRAFIFIVRLCCVCIFLHVNRWCEVESGMDNSKNYKFICEYIRVSPVVGVSVSIMGRA